MIYGRIAQATISVIGPGIRASLIKVCKFILVLFKSKLPRLAELDIGVLD